MSNGKGAWCLNGALFHGLSTTSQTGHDFRAGALAVRFDLFTKLLDIILAEDSDSNQSFSGTVSMVWKEGNDGW